MKVELLDAALDDLVQGFTFYERQSAGVGDYFLESLFADLESLRVCPEVHAEHFGYHRMLARRFPFAIYYRVENQAIRVYAVLDCRMNPAWTRERLA